MTGSIEAGLLASLPGQRSGYARDVSSQVTIPPRRTLNARRTETLARIFDATEQLLDELGHEAMTIRIVADRAGVSPATAYGYVASKDHLFAELFWRRLVQASFPALQGRGRTDRLQHAMRQLTDFITARPALAAAATKSLLGQDPEVARLRLDIGRFLIQRFSEALGDPVDHDLLNTVSYAFTGALLQAGMGLVAYDELGDQLGRIMSVIMKGHR